MSSDGIRRRLAWAPDIPPGWDVVNLNMLARIFAGGTPDRKNMEYWEDGTVPWLNSGSVNDWAISRPSELISRAALADGATRRAPKGAVLVALAGQGKTKGMAARLELDSTFNQSLAAIVPGPSLEYRFLQYWLTSNYLNIRGLAGGDLRDGLNLQHIGAIQVPRPPLHKQRAIADYLDRETAQIDAFIAKNEELITLLTERRAAVIDEGLIRAAAGASVVPLKRAVQFVTVGIVVTPAKWYAESGVPALRGINVRPGSISMDNLVFLSDEGHEENRKSELRTGDVVIVRTGQAGAAAVVPAELDRANAIDLLIVRTGTKVVPNFLAYFLNSNSTSRLIAHGSVGSIQGHFNVGTLREVPVPLLPTDEQEALVQVLDEQAEQIDRAIATARRGVDLARERRSALVSAAVTGKIKVEVAA